MVTTDSVVQLKRIGSEKQEAEACQEIQGSQTAHMEVGSEACSKNRKYRSV
jgi:hypothetical protein